ncbi:putative oxidoreductase [Armadillidium nasatum]|uniref:Putative oxidoreductase n=1 Tax=Armadillidium nasatum TaxID=96803 RepID=A0A5N5SN65_9CRUS|nr:putative oxidoreductase [Armadillidium nasatum]
MSPVQYITLSNGQKMPQIGLGTVEANDDDLRRAIGVALDTGYRAIDTAYVYLNEKAIGDELQERFSKNKIKRDEIFVTTKLPLIGNRPEDVPRFLSKSLQNLKLDFIDLYLIHHPFGLKCLSEDNTLAQDENGVIQYDNNTDLENIWKAMEKEIEIHCYFPQRKLVDFCKERNIAVTAYSPLGAPWTEEGKSVEPKLLENPLVLEMAKKHGKTAPQILLRFLIQRNLIVIPKSVTPERIKSNFDAFKDELRNAIRVAFESGYRAIDTAFMYSNEEFIGEEIQDWLSKGKLKREDIFITTKVKNGRVRSIGLSNFNKSQIDRILKEIPPAVLQIEAHCYFPQKPLVEYCQKKGIAVTAYSPLGAPWTKEGQEVSPKLLENPTVLEIAKKYNKNAGQVLLRFLVQRNIIVIPKSITPERIRSNFQISSTMKKQKNESY